MSPTPSHYDVRSLLAPRCLPRALKLGALLLVAFAGGAVAAEIARATTEQEEPEYLLRQLAQVLVLVENEYVDPVDRQRLLEGSIKGMVAELDPHSSYMPPSDYSVFQADTKGEFGGIGVEVDFRNDVVTVIGAVEGSPAARAGIQPGDVVVAIDRTSVQGKPSSELVRRMRGKPGSSVTVTIRRRDRESPIDFTLTREIIEVASVAGSSLDGNIAYLRLKQFQSGTHTELLQTIAKLRAEQGIGGVILDLRNNPGGLVDEAAAVADEFLGTGVIYTTRHRNAIVDEVRSTPNGALIDPPLVVLVNEYSASAAELLAGALQDQARGTIVGARTFGKGSVQSIIGLPGGAGLRLTTMRYYTPKGHAIQADGIQPDVTVESGFVPDTSLDTTREQDLENHLPAEGKPSTPSPAPALKPSHREKEETGVSPTYLGVARVVPKNPSGGPDFALSIGYQIVRDVLKKQH